MEQAAIVFKKERARSQRAAAKRHYDQLLDACPLMAFLSDGSYAFFPTQQETQTKGSDGTQAAQQNGSEGRQAVANAGPANEMLRSEVDTLQRKNSELEQAVISQRREMQVLLTDKESEAKNFKVDTFMAPFCLLCPSSTLCLLFFKGVFRADDARHVDRF